MIMAVTLCSQARPDQMALSGAYPEVWHLVIPDVLEESCSTRQALERFASKWRVLVIYALLVGPQRHAQLRRRLAGITQKMLTQTLREMEADGMIERRVLKESAPQHVEYALTEMGKTMHEPLAAICDWAPAHPPVTVMGPGARR
jgi:DNA-binding HxlR family transcriptional regulator